jgi:hypothetical protein
MEICLTEDLYNFFKEITDVEIIIITFKPNAINACIMLAGFKEKTRLGFKLDSQWRKLMRKRSWERGEKRKFYNDDERQVEIMIYENFDHVWFIDNFFSAILKIEIAQDQNQAIIYDLSRYKYIK